MESETQNIDFLLKFGQNPASTVAIRVSGPPRLVYTRNRKGSFGVETHAEHFFALSN